MNHKTLLVVAIVLTALGIIAKLILIYMPQPVRFDDLGPGTVKQIEETK